MTSTESIFLDLEMLKLEIGSPSMFAKQSKDSNSNFLNSKPSSLKKRVIKCHRPYCSPIENIPITLLDPIFALFYDIKNTNDPIPQKVYETCTMLCNKTSLSSFATEKERNNLIIDYFLNYFGIRLVVSKSDLFETDGSLFINSNMSLCLEVKNERGLTNEEPYLQVVAYYSNYLLDTKLPQPCFLLEMDGPHIAISGAFFTGKNIIVDPLTPSYPLYLFRGNIYLDDLARSLNALDGCINSLKLTNMVERDLSFPYITEFGGYSWNYVLRVPDKLVFVVNLTMPSGEIKQAIVKFSETYGADVHRICHKAKFSPELYLSGKISGGWHISIMEFVSSLVPIQTPLNQELKDQLISFKNLLNANALVHGDLRKDNFKLNNGNLCVIDFDWSGKSGHVKYPSFLCDELLSNKNIGSGKSILIEHDDFFLNNLLT